MSEQELLAKEFLDFVNASASPFHAVETCKKYLTKAGFTELQETEPITGLTPGKSYFFTRNQSSIIAFSVGGKYKAGNGFSIVGAHTDSPNLKVKPVNNTNKSGYFMVSCEPYGGGLWRTWFDRDLTVAGRIIVKDGEGLRSKLVHVKRPILRIPNLAIHLDRTSNSEFKFNAEENLVPMLATAVKGALESSGDASPSTHPHLVKLLSEELSADPSEVVNFELYVTDVQPACIGGLYNEFIFSPRLDNLMSCFISLKALIDSVGTGLDNEENVRLICLFDHEEVGSNSAYGAGGTMLGEAIERITCSFMGDSKLPVQELLSLARRRSFFLSADMAHALHPNYATKHDVTHRPRMHEGTVIKYNANQRYATTAETAAIVIHIAKKHGIPIQEFVVRNDIPCGSTIGPIVSTELGIRTIDIGAPQLAMHSIREMCGVDDCKHYYDLMKAFFDTFTALDKVMHMN